MDSAPTSPPVGAASYIFHDWTVIVLILIAVFAVLVIAGMIWGQKKARERHVVEEAAEERAEEVGTTLPPASPPPPTEADAGLPRDEPRPEPEPETPRTPAPAPPVARDPEPQPLAARELAPEPIAASVAEPEPVAPTPEPVAKPVPTPKPVADAPAESAAPPSPPEPVAAPPAPSPSPSPTVTPAPAANVAGALALTTIKGLGPKVAAMLAERGITRVDQLAALSPDDASALDLQLGAFTGRMERDRWIEQAKLLAAGDTAAYEAEFGKLG
jgi:predicted flap endonuclease-1-like 5' DNA nuclease